MSRVLYAVVMVAGVYGWLALDALSTALATMGAR